MRQKVTQLKISSDCLIYWIGMSSFVLVLMNKKRKFPFCFLKNQNQYRFFLDTKIDSKPKSSLRVNMFSIGMWCSKLVWLFDFSSLGVKKVFFLFQLFSKEFSKFVHGLFEICNRDIPTTAWPHFWSTKWCKSQQNVDFWENSWYKKHLLD